MQPPKMPNEHYASWLQYLLERAVERGDIGEVIILTNAIAVARDRRRRVLFAPLAGDADAC